MLTQTTVNSRQRYFFSPFNYIVSLDLNNKAMGVVSKSPTPLLFRLILPKYYKTSFIQLSIASDGPY